MIDGPTFLDQPVKNNSTTYDIIQKMKTGQGDDYTTAFQLECNSFSNYYKMMLTDLSKQQTLDADPKAIQKINYTIFITEEAKETISDESIVTAFHNFIFF